MAEVMNWADVVVARGRSDAVLVALRAGADAGVPVLDPAEAVAGVRDKVAMAKVLRRAGVPTPATFVAPKEMLVARVPLTAYPLILKPVFGDNGGGLEVVMTRRELQLIDWPERPALAQSFLPTDGVDLKVYAIGNQLSAVHKPSPITPCARTGAWPAVLDDGLANLARTCGRLFGLSMYGVDLLDTPSGLVVVEVNDFPNFTAVPDANELLAGHVLGAVQPRARRGRTSV
jgi:ribosomal protein S6--L-glutamate ligase